MADVDITIVTEIEGLAELEEAFTSGNARAVKKFLTRVQKQAADVLVKSAEEYAPWAEGDLAEDIHKQTVVGDGTLTVRVGPSSKTFWGLFQEFGAPEANVPALHWLEDSARAVQDEVLEQYQIAVTEGLAEMKK
jgi:hypothetical protein